MDDWAAPIHVGANLPSPGSLSIPAPAKSTQFGYDAVKTQTKRAPATGILWDEDAELNRSERRKLLSSTRDLGRNFAIASWAINRHLDYVSSFAFKAHTGDSALDDRIQYLMRDWSGRRNCEVTGRFGLPQLIRLNERLRTVDGDMFLSRLAIGKLQVIEGDRVATPLGGLPAGYSAAEFCHGVKLDEYGAASAYAVCTRKRTNDGTGGSSELRFERLLSAEHVYHHFYINRYDQVRGVSPLASALNSLRDVYEGMDYALTKLKVEQLFGIVFKRAASDDIGVSETYDPVDFGSGPVQLDLDPGDDVDFLKTDNPGTNSQNFLSMTISVALKALDIPFSFFDESYTNYSGARQALLQYEESAKVKRLDNIEMLNWITAWKIKHWMDLGLLPRVVLHPWHWDWVPSGLPWIDPKNEVEADELAVQSKFSSRQRVCKKNGVDFFEIVDEQAEEEAYVAAKLNRQAVVEPVEPGAADSTEEQDAI